MNSIRIPVTYGINNHTYAEVTPDLARQIVALGHMAQTESMIQQYQIPSMPPGMIAIDAGLKAPLNAMENVPAEPFLGEAHQTDLEKAHEIAAEDRSCGLTPVDAGDEDDAQEIVNRIHMGTTRQCDAARIANIIAALRARLADAERRADEMEGKAGEWVAVDVHKERVESARADAVAMNKRLLGERDAAWKENARILARVAELERQQDEMVKLGGEYAKKCDKLEADLAAERERAFDAGKRLTDMAEELATFRARMEEAEACYHVGPCMVELAAARAEAAALKARKVKLPPYNTCADVPNFADGFAHGRAAVIDAIRAAGVEVES